MNRTVKVTHIAMLITFAAVIHFVEFMFPLPIPVPGAKLGLANVITLLTLLVYGTKAGLLVAGGRSLLGSFFTGSFLGFGFWLSFSAALVSCLVMALFLPLTRKQYVTPVAVSVIGAVTHNLIQLLVAIVIMQNPVLFQGYFPILTLVAIPTGIITGLAALYLEGTVRRNLGAAW